MFSQAAGRPIGLEEEERELLSLWEAKVRERVMGKTRWPTAAPYRWKLPAERQSLTHRFEIPGSDGPLEAYLTTGMYPNQRLGEVFLAVAKEGSFVSGIMDALMTSISIALQYGVPLTTFAGKFKHTRFQPSGFVKGAPEPIAGMAKSVVDYIFRYLEYRYPGGMLREAIPELDPPAPDQLPPGQVPDSKKAPDSEKAPRLPPPAVEKGSPEKA
jgi:ribonucleoside-diphosphate reductase alpha chain